MKKQSPNIVAIDYSFNETMPNTERLALPKGDYHIHVYSLVDVMAEKFRSLLQQTVRNRNRRQDVFDIHLLINQETFDDADKTDILKSLIGKSKSRGVHPKEGSLSEPDIYNRALRDYESLELELSEPLPDFDQAFHLIEGFYKSLPW